MNWHLRIFLDSFSATFLHIDNLCLRNAVSLVVSIPSQYYFMYPYISYAGLLSLKEFPHLIPIPNLFYVELYFYFSIPTQLSFLLQSISNSLLYPPPLQCYFYLNYTLIIVHIILYCGISLYICVIPQNGNILREYMRESIVSKDSLYGFDSKHYHFLCV